MNEGQVELGADATQGNTNVCIGYTHHDLKVPNINTVGLGDIKYDLWCLVGGGLNLIGVRHLSKAGFAKIAKYWATEKLRGL